MSKIVIHDCQKCYIKSCINKSTKYNIYCNIHQYLCAEQLCNNRVERDNMYCTQHSIFKCKFACNNNVPRENMYCNFHPYRTYCKENSCKNIVEKFGFYCEHHMYKIFLCKYKNCNNQMANSTTSFCHSHMKKCSKSHCNNRISCADEYCHHHSHYSNINSGNTCHYKHCKNSKMSHNNDFCNLHLYNCDVQYCDKRVSIMGKLCDYHKCPIQCKKCHKYDNEKIKKLCIIHNCYSKRNGNSRMCWEHDHPKPMSMKDRLHLVAMG